MKCSFQSSASSFSVSELHSGLFKKFPSPSRVAERDSVEEDRVITDEVTTPQQRMYVQLLFELRCVL